MLKRIMGVLVVAMLTLSLCACGSNGNSAASSSKTSEYDPAVDTIDLTLDKGGVRFVRAEKANANLTDSENAYVFVFEFTNAQDKPAAVQSVFRFQFFQNGAELSDHPSYSSRGGEQYDLVDAFFDSAMTGGTVTFGRLVALEDESPVTVMVSPNGAALDDNYQMMEVAINASGAVGSAASPASVDAIDAALQGTWSVENQGTFTFNQGALTVDGSGAVISGTYEINVDESSIVGHLEASDGSLKVTLPYEYADNTLKVFNNRGNELVKM